MNWMRWNFRCRARSHGSHRERLRQPRHAFEQHVPIGKEADEEAVDEVPLADQDALDRTVERIELRPQFLGDDGVGHGFLGARTPS